MSPTQLTIAGLVPSVLSAPVLAALVTTWINRRKTNAETDSIAVAASNQVIAMLQSELTEDRKRCDRQLAEHAMQISALKDEVAALKAQLGKPL